MWPERPPEDETVRESIFLRRLRRELPVWVARGWVAPTNQEEILDHVAAQRGVGVRYLPLALSILGVLLFGSGVITYFAANWNVIPKLGKLIILLGSMWFAYAAAGTCLERKKSPQLGEAMLLLGVILFGANIMLIAQIYHIDAHYPNGVLLWAVGGLLTAYLMSSQAAMIAAIALGLLWSGMETFGFEWKLHWPFLVVWASCVPAIYRRRWMPAWYIAVLALLAWSWLMFPQIVRFTDGWSTNTLIYLTQVYLLAYVGMFVFGLVMATDRKLTAFSDAIQRAATFGTLMSSYVLTFPDLHRGLQWRESNATFRAVAQSSWIAVTLVVVAAVIVLALWHRTRTTSIERPAYLNWGDGLLGLMIALLLTNLFVTGEYGGGVAIAFNLLFLAGLIWLIIAGMRTHDPFLVNTAFLFFGLGLLSRYFDTFWTLLNRSYFFMGGGLLLIGGGYLLERQRRRLMARIRAAQAQ